MQSTINLALHNACTHLDLPPTFAAAVIAHLWRIHTMPAPLPAPVHPVTNIEKLNRQQVQKLEELAKQAGNDEDEKSLHKLFLTYINEMSVEGFKSSSLIEHMRNYLGLSGSAAPPPPEDDDEDLVEVSWHLRTYDVGIKTQRVYEMRNGVHVFVGMFGMNEFRGMVMPEYE